METQGKISEAQTGQDKDGIGTVSSSLPRGGANYLERPRTIEEAMILAQIMSQSSLVPKDYQNNPANILIAMGLGDALGMNAFQSVQNIAVINGRPCLWGDYVKALAMNSPEIEWIKERPIQEVKEKGAGLCTVKMRNHEPYTVEFSIEDAKTAKLWMKTGRDGQLTPWVTYPYRMLQFRARGFALRDCDPRLLKGISIAEEILDVEPESIKNRNMMPKMIGETPHISSISKDARGAWQKVQGFVNRKLEQFGIAVQKKQEEVKRQPELSLPADKPRTDTSPITQSKSISQPTVKSSEITQPVEIGDRHIAKAQLDALLRNCERNGIPETSLVEYCQKKFGIRHPETLKQKDFLSARNWTEGEGWME